MNAIGTKTSTRFAMNPASDDTAGLAHVRHTVEAMARTEVVEFEAGAVEDDDGAAFEGVRVTFATVRSVLARQEGRA